MKFPLKVIIYMGLLVGMLFILAACAPAPAAPAAVDCPDCPEAAECPDCPTCPESEACPEPEMGASAPFEEMWKASGHNDIEAEAFRHWDGDDPAVVAPACAKCHSGQGFRDFLGVDGSDAGSIDNEIAAMENETITCETCHNEATMSMDSVSFPQTYVPEEGADPMHVTLSGLGSDAVCMNCHQGRESSSSVNARIAAAFEKAEMEVDADTMPMTTNDDGDEVNSLGFANIHYYAAAATRYGTEVKGGYEYAGKGYDSFFAHVPSVDNCTECHSSHSLELKLDTCSNCHEGVDSVEALRDVREPSSSKDYDGDGDAEEGVYYEVEGLKDALYAALQAFASDAGSPIAYEAHTYPYFFADGNGDGEAGEDEANYGNSFKGWTPRLLKAAYNYQVSMKDPGGYAHGGKYIIQLLYDSIEDLGGDVSMMHRDDAGHFDASSEAWRHWDEDGEVPASCAKCHSAEGLPQLAMEGVVTSAETSSGLLCESCHNTAEWPALYAFEATTFPSGAKLSFGEDMSASNLCLNCHQGRESTVSVNAKIGDAADDAVTEGLGFRNVHYFAAGATMFGSDAQGGYEYSGKTYAGLFAHTGGFDSCLGCHDAHELEPKAEACSGCHATDEFEAIRMTSVADYDGDGDAAEGLKAEIEGMKEALYTALQAYAADTIGTAVIYDSHAYPYFFNDSNGNGAIDPGEAIYPNAYSTWSPRLLRAAYNFQYASKDPGGYVHNFAYVGQLLYDSIDDLGAAGGMTRP
jgi:hypothetical protein